MNQTQTEIVEGRCEVRPPPLPRPDSPGWWWEWWGGQWQPWRVVEKGHWLYLVWPDGKLMGVQRLNGPKMRLGGEWYKAALPPRLNSELVNRVSDAV